VNNVGVMTPYPMLVSEMTETQIWEHVNVNVAATTLMTRVLLSDMVLRGRGIVVNLSSFAQVGPDPLITVYAASKVSCAFLQLSHFTILEGIRVDVEVHECTRTLIIVTFIISAVHRRLF
jgi:short-subunit dehydrogenase